MLNDRFEIESIKQEQGFFKHRLETIKNDINQMQKYSEKVKPYQVGTKATLVSIEGANKDRKTFLDGNQEQMREVDLEA